MFSKFLIFTTLISLGFAAAVVSVKFRNDASPVAVEIPKTTVASPDVPSKLAYINLPVPFILESPEGSWKGNWINGCEEASITMVEKFYLGEQSVPAIEAQAFMEKLFAYENSQYGSNANSDAARTVEIINNNTSFSGVVKENPTIDDIKDELRNGRPVISLHYGFALNNKNIPFLATGSGYHMMVIKGFDDARNVFITNDDGDKVAGADHLYDYELFMDSIHDYVYATHKTNGPATVLFTSKN